MSRIVLKSSNTAVVIGESPAFKTTDDSGSLFSSVKSASFGFSSNRQKIKQIGDKNLIADDLVRSPDVDLSLSYTYSPTYANEDLMGLSFSLNEKSELSLISSLKDKSYNFYFYNNPEQGEDGIQSIKDQNYLPGGEIISFGNAFLNSYGLNFEVGSIPEVSVSFSCSNVESEKYFGVKTKSPAINLQSGNNNGVGDFDITKTKILEEKFFGEIYDLDRSHLATPTPSELEFTLQDLQIGGQKLSPNNHILNSFKFDMNIERASYYKLGSNYACGRDIKYPINATISMSSLVSSYENGFISGLIKGQDVNFLDIVATDCSGLITSKLFFENLKVEQVRYDMLVNESMNYSLDLSLQINDEEGFKSFVTEEDWKTTRVYDSGNSILDFKLGDIPANYWNNDDNIYKVRFADFSSYEVGDRAFYDCDNISGSLFFPKNVNYIGESAFESCDNLEKLFFDSDHSIDEIGSSGFKDCVGLNNENLLFPYSLRTLNESCFQGCSNIKGISLNDISSIGDKSFFLCSGLKGPITFSQRLTYLGDSSFENCFSLNGSVEFPDSLTTINQKAFKNCGSLEGDLEINNFITDIGAQAFYGCTGLDGALSLSNNLSYIESGTFFNCFSITGELFLPEGISGVGEYAFYNLGVNSLYLPESLEYIYEGAFERLNNIKTDLDLPENLKVIGDRAFADGLNFSEYLEIPSGIQSIGEHAFSGCIGINDVYINSPASVFQGDNSFYGVGGCLFVSPRYYNDYLNLLQDGRFQGMPVCLGSKNTIVYDAQSFDVLKIKRGDIPSNWYSNQTLESIVIIGSTCELIKNDAFSDSVGLIGGLIIPSGVKYIGENAFKNCSFSGDLIIDDSVTGIGKSAFENCSGFDGNFQVPFYLDIIEENTFKNCSSLQSSVIIPPRVGRIEKSAFENCSGLNGTLSLPAQCEYIGDKSFDNCSSFSGGLVFPQSLTGIGNAAFRNCSNFNEEIEFAENILSIGDSGFYNCNGISGSLELPEFLEYLGEYAFYNCSSLTDRIIIPGGLTGILLSTFENCSGLGDNLILPPNLSGIGERSFYNCTSLSGFISLTDICAQNIGTDALFGTSFTNLVVDETVEDISIGEFDYFKNYSMALTLQNGLLSISNSGFKDYNFTGDFFLPQTVDLLGDSSFENISTFDGFYDFSQSNISSIGKRAFKNCNGISGSLVFQDTLFYIGDEAFRNNSSINGELALPQELTGIGEYAFAGNSSMTGNLNIPDTVSGLGQYAFLDCSSLNGFIKLSANPFLTKVATGTFKGCSSLTGDLTIPDNITNVEYQAFKNCFELSGTITLTDTAALSLIGKDALDESDFQHLVISDYVVEVSNGEFDYFENKDLSLTLSQNITGILENSFDNYQVTGDLVFPESLLYIGDNAFKSCDGLIGELNFPEFVSGIGSSAFEGCIGFSGDLTLSIDLELGVRTFYNCIGLDGVLTISDFTASSVNPSDNTFFGTNFYMLRAESLDGTISDTEFDVFSSSFQGDLDIGLSVNAIGSNAFDNYSFLGGFYCSGVLSEISEKAFSGVQFSGDYTPEFVNQIGNGAFANCGFDRNAIFLNSTEIIGDKAFLNCDSLKGDLVLPPTLISIGDDAFFDCTGFDGKFDLSSAEEGISDLPSFTTSLTSIGQRAFVGCTGVSGNLIIPGAVTSIGQEAFLDMLSLNGYLYITASGLTTIEQSIFRGCSNLNTYNGKLSIPRSVTSIEINAFRDCSSLQGSLELSKEAARGIASNAFLNTNFDNITVLSGANFIDDGDFDYFQTTGVSLTLNSDLINIKSGAFDDFNLTGSLVIPSDVSGIGDRAFANNDGFIGNLTIPRETFRVGDFAFSGCSGFSALSFANYEFSRVDDIGSGAFKNCAGFSNQLILPSPLETIKSGAFQGCSGLIGRLEIPDNLEEIGEHAFSGCTGINGVFIDTLGPEVFTVEQGKAFEGCSGYLELGVLIYTDYQNLSTQIGNDFYFQGMPISGVGASESIFYTGAVGDTNILNREAQDEIDVQQEGQPYVIPANWKDNTARAAAGITSAQPLWFSLGALCEEIGDNAFNGATYMQGTLSLGGDLRIIGASAFTNNNKVTGLSLGNNIEVIKESAFQNCSKIKSSIVFGSNLTGIEKNAFFGTDIPSITFVEGIKEIGNGAFQACDELVGNIEFPASLDTIGSNAFESNRFSRISFLNPNLLIGSYAFNSSSRLEEINLPTNTSFIGNGAFVDCIEATGNLNLPSSLDLIPYTAFEDCEKIGSLTLNGQSRFGGYAFRRCHDLNKDTDGSLQIPEEVVSNNGYLSYGSFQDCRSIKSVTFPNNFSGTNIRMQNQYGGVFQGCSSLEQVNFGIGLDVVTLNLFYGCIDLSGLAVDDWNSLTGIEPAAFYNTPLLPRIYIPANVTEVQTSAFKLDNTYLDTNLTEELVYVASGNLKTIGATAFEGRAFTSTYLPESLPFESGFYLDNYCYKSCKYISPTISIPDCVSGMGKGVFENCSSAQNYTWPTALTEIKDRTFYDCTSIEDIYIPTWVDIIGNQSFYNCQSASGTLNIHSDVTYIGPQCFYNCESLQQVLFNNTNQIDILSETFRYCSSLSGALVLNNVRDVYTKAFNDTDIDFIQWNNIDGPNYISTTAFQDNKSLTGISLPSGLRSIGRQAFQSADNLKEFDISDTYVSEISQTALYATKGLSGVDAINLNNGQLLDIGDSAFSTSNVEYIEIPDPVTNIGGSCFSSCTNLKEIDFSTTQLTEFKGNLFSSAFYRGFNNIIMPVNLDTVGVSCFEASNISGTVDFSETNLISLGYRSFERCDLLEAVKFPATTKTIGFESFEDCDNLVWISGDGLEELGNKMFSNSPNFSGFMGHPSGLPSSLKEIGNETFAQCDNIKPRQNYLISGNMESIGNSNWSQQNSTQSLVIHDSFSGSIGNNNWDTVSNMGALSILFDNTNASIGSNNWKNCNLMTDVYINCPYSVWVGTNNFDNASSNIDIRIKSIHYNDYINNNWSGQQGVNANATISSYVP